MSSLLLYTSSPISSGVAGGGGGGGRGGKRGNSPHFFQGERVGGRESHVVTLGDEQNGEVLATATEEHRTAEHSNAEIAIGTQNTGGRAFSAHTRAPANRNATLKSFTISIIY